MRHLTIALCSLLFSSLACADQMFVYGGQQSPRGQLYRNAYETCISKFTGAVGPTGLLLNAAYYAGKSLKTNTRIVYINGSIVKDGDRVDLGISCKTDYRGAKVTSLRASIGAHYVIRNKSTGPELLAGD